MKRFAAPLVLLLAACGSGTDEDGVAKLRAFAEAEAPCETAADCCVVIDGCLATAYVVGASDYDAARKVASGLEHDACVNCIAPAVQLACEAGRCVGLELAPGTAGWEGSTGGHCGEVPADAGAFVAAPATDTGRVLGCGG